ncbi:hypothetical protein COCON_G00073930 [Conger conger]|uniref:PARP catalytic domain-containing protein n=1 Tax=Conger conger TaxID=82655 RepID=A0A9Q1DP07_CONCO|nr:hypothetical protein COCON_G00073930 [Conger conger]
MYHGTSKEAAESIRCYGFSPSKDSMLGRCVYLSHDIQKASRYPLNLTSVKRTETERDLQEYLQIWKYEGRRMSWAGHDNMGPRPLCLQSHSKPTKNSSYIMYHGTSKEAAESIMRNGFTPSIDGMLGRGVYLSRNIQKASRYPLNLANADRRVLELKVNVGRVKKIDRQGHPLQKTWHDAGYNTAWVPPNCGMVPSGEEEDCVWNPHRIKVIRVIRVI